MSVTAPSFDRYLQEIGPYDEAHQYIQKMAYSFGIPYLDFNLCRKEYLDLGEDSYIDVDHLNGQGALQLTTLLAELDGPLEAIQTGTENSGEQGLSSLNTAESVQEFVDEYFTAWYDKE